MIYCLIIFINMIVEIIYLIINIFVLKLLCMYMYIAINKSKLEREEDLYLRLIYNKITYFKYFTEKDTNINEKINEIIAMYKIYLIKFRLLNSSKYSEISKVIKKHNIKYLVLQNIKEMLINSNKYDIYSMINSLILEINPKYDIENNNDNIMLFNKSQNKITIIST